VRVNVYDLYPLSIDGDFAALAIDAARSGGFLEARRKDRRSGCAAA
jgi:hypothetical protein